MPKPEQPLGESTPATPEEVDVLLPNGEVDLDIDLGEKSAVLSPDLRSELATQREHLESTHWEYVRTIQALRQMQESLDGKPLPDPGKVSAELSPEVREIITNTAQILMELSLNTNASQHSIEQQLERIAREERIEQEIRVWTKRMTDFDGQVQTITQRLEGLDQPAPALTDRERAEDLLKRIQGEISLSPMPTVKGNSTSPQEPPKKGRGLLTKLFRSSRS